MNDMPASDVVLKAEGLQQTFRMGRTEVKALRGVDLEIREGETVSIMGASGAGKSTLLQVLGGLEAPSGGKVFYKGKDVYRMGPRAICGYRARDIGFVFQSYHLLPELKVVENIMLPALSQRGALSRIGGLRKRAAALAEGVGLSARLDHLPSELSGGECQRVALARALMNDPPLVLADEPTGNLDSETGGQVLDLLFRLVLEEKRTLVMVTHDQQVAASCQRQLRLKDGSFAPETGE